MTKPKYEKIEARQVRSGDDLRWQQGCRSRVFESAQVEWGTILLHEWQPACGGPTRVLLPHSFNLERVLHDGA